MWEYFEKNIGSDDIVAKFINTQGLPILYVFELKDSYIAKPCSRYDFLNSISISYNSTHDEEAEKKLSSSHDILVNRLKIACKLIEKKYNEQISHIRSMIG